MGFDCTHPVQICNHSTDEESLKTLEPIVISTSDNRQFEGVICPTCKSCIALYTKEGLLQNVEQSLASNSHRQNGWQKAETEEDFNKHLILNFVTYRYNESPNQDNFESNFDVPLTQDKVMLMWVDNIAVGFATVRLDVDCSVIDTVFVRQSHRRTGLASLLIQDLLEGPKEGTSLLGLSQPISNGMFAVMLRFLLKHPTHRNSVFLIDKDDVGRQYLWWSAAKLARERNIVLKSLMYSI